MISIQQPDHDFIAPLKKLLDVNTTRGHFLAGRLDFALNACLTNSYHGAPAIPRVAIMKDDPWGPEYLCGFYLMTRADKSLHQDGLRNAQELYILAVDDYFQKKGIGRLLLDDAITNFIKTTWADWLICRTHRNISTRMEHLLTQACFTLIRQEETVNAWAIKK